MNQNVPANICRPLYQYMKILRNISRCSQRLTSSSPAENPEKVNIPLRVRRGPTDILKALAATVHDDPSGPAYKFYDDPYLYPLSSVEKKTYALSRESGKKAARWIRDNHAEYFNHQPDVPIIKEFLPKLQFNEDSEVSETDLVNSIKYFQVSDAINIYNICQSKDIEVSVETRQSLLELVSFYNCEEAMDEEWLEEMKSQFMLKSARPTKTWKDDGLAEELFKGLKEVGAAPYCAIIKGMCAFYQVDKAWQMYQECLGKELIPDTETFNALIRVAPMLREENEFRWTLVQEILQKMVDAGAAPNLGTMNAVLLALSTMRSWIKTRTIGLQVLAEFEQFGIKPSLASYFFLLRIFYTMKNPSSPLLPSVLDHIESQEFALRDPNDAMFFFSAMEVCKRDLQSMETAQRLNAMLAVGKNRDLIGGNIKFIIYHRNYFRLACNSLPLEEFMKIYDLLVPHLYSPDREVMEEIVKAIGMNESLSLLPRIWSDCVRLEVARNEKLMEMSLMVINKAALEEFDLALQEQLANVAWDIWTRVQNQNEGLRFKIEWSGLMLGDCISSLVRCGEVAKACEILTEVEEKPSMVLGELPVDTLKLLFGAVMQQELFKVALSVAKYAKDNEYPDAYEMAKQLSKQESLPKEVKTKLVSSFGTEIS